MSRMRQDSAPFYLKAQLRSEVELVETLANQKGLAQAFEMDLFSLKRTAEDALATGEREATEHALEQARALEAKIRSTPGKSDPMLLR